MDIDILFFVEGKPSYVKKEIVDFFYITLPERL